MTGSVSGFRPPTNDWLNAAINFGGTFLPTGAGFGIDVLKGIGQNAFSGLQANTNPMSYGQSLLYGPGMGERFVNWLSALFGGSGPSATPADGQFMTSVMQGSNAPVQPVVITPQQTNPGISGAPNQLNAITSSGGAYTPDYTWLVSGNSAGTGFGYGGQSLPFDVIGGDAGWLAQGGGGGPGWYTQADKIITG